MILINIKIYLPRKKSINSSSLMFKKESKGSPKKTLADPVMPNTIKIITNWKLDLIPHLFLNLLMSKIIIEIN